VRRFQAMGHLRKGDMTHALAGIFRQMLASPGGQGDFAVQQPGVVAFVQGDADRLAVHGQGVVVIQGLFQQQAVARHGVATQRAFVVPEIEEAGAQAAQCQRVALRRGARLDAGMFRRLFAQCITGRDDEDFRLAGRAGGNRAGQFFPGEIPLSGLVGGGQVQRLVLGVGGHWATSLSISSCR